MAGSVIQANDTVVLHGAYWCWCGDCILAQDQLQYPLGAPFGPGGGVIVMLTPVKQNSNLLGSKYQ